MIYIVSNLSPDRSHLPFADNTKVFTDPVKALALFREWEGATNWMSGCINIPRAGTKQISYCGDVKVEMLTLEITD